MAAGVSIQRAAATEAARPVLDHASVNSGGRAVEPWDYVKPPQNSTWKWPWPQAFIAKPSSPMSTTPMPRPMPTNPYVEITEALAKELAKVRAELTERQETGEITPEQVCDLMYQAFINGIQWALDNMPELAALDKNRPAYGSKLTADQIAELMKAFTVTCGGTTTSGSSSHWGVFQPGQTANVASSVQYTAVNGQS